MVKKAVAERFKRIIRSRRQKALLSMEKQPRTFKAEAA